jgi:hypothetical protein
VGYERSGEVFIPHPIIPHGHPRNIDAVYDIHIINRFDGCSSSAVREGSTANAAAFARAARFAV